MNVDTLSQDEIKVIHAMREEQAAREAKYEFQRKAIATALAFEEWSAKTGYGLTFSTFVNTFGYQEEDSMPMYEAIQRIQQAALPR